MRGINNGLGMDMRGLLSVLLLSLVALDSAAARGVPTASLNWAVPLSDVVVIGEVVGVSDSEAQLKLGYPTLRDAVFTRRIADVKVVYAIKNARTNETLRLSYIADADSTSGLINGPTYFEPKTNGMKYLMFLRKHNEERKEFVAVSDPYDSPVALVELSRSGEGFRDARWRSESGKRAIHDFAEALLKDRPREGIGAIEYHYFCVEYYEQLSFLIEALEKGPAAMAKRVEIFAGFCKSADERERRRKPPDAEAGQSPGPGWETDYPDKSFWWFDRQKER